MKSYSIANSGGSRAMSHDSYWQNPTDEGISRRAGEIAEGEFASRPGISRRNFLRAAGIIVVGTTFGEIAKDTSDGREHWGGTEPQIHHLFDRQSMLDHPNEAWFCLGGFGVKNSLDIMKALQPAARESGQMFGVEYDNRGLHIGDIARSIIEACRYRQITAVKLYGHSLGGIFAVGVSKYLAEAGINVRAIVHDCTPSGTADVKDEQAFEVHLLSSLNSALEFVDKTPLDLSAMGPKTRFMIEMGSRATHIVNGDMSLGEACRQALEKTDPASCSNTLLVTEASALHHFSVVSAVHQIPRTTQMFRLHPTIPELDHVIDNSRAFSNWSRALSKVGHSYSACNVGFSGHANPTVEQELYQESLRKINRHLRPLGRPHVVPTPSPMQR